MTSAHRHCLKPNTRTADADATQLDSCVASASAVCIGHSILGSVRRVNRAALHPATRIRVCYRRLVNGYNLRRSWELERKLAWNMTRLKSHRVVGTSKKPIMTTRAPFSQWDFLYYRPSIPFAAVTCMNSETERMGPIDFHIIITARIY